MHKRAQINLMMHNNYACESFTHADGCKQTTPKQKEGSNLIVSKPLIRVAKGYLILIVLGLEPDLVLIENQTRI